MSKSNIGEQAISKAAEVGINSQLDEVEELNVDIETNPLDLAGGNVDSVTVDGKGMVMNKDLRAERLIIDTDSIKIDSMKAALGNIELEQNTNAEARVVLLEDDIQRAFNSGYIKNKLQNQKVDVDGETVTVNVDNVKFSLPGEDKIGLNADLEIVESQENKQISLQAKPKIDADGNKIAIADVEYPDGENSNPELTKALLDSTKEILDLRNFELDEMSLQIDRLDVSQGKIIMAASALIREFPDD